MHRVVPASICVCVSIMGAVMHNALAWPIYGAANRCIWQISRFYGRRLYWSELSSPSGRLPRLTKTQSFIIVPWEAPYCVLWIFSQGSQQNPEVRGQVKNLEGPQLFSPLRLWVAKVLQSTISAPVSPLLSQRKGIQRGPEGLSQPPVPREMGVSLTTMDKSLMTSRQCTLAPHCCHDQEKCFHKHMSGLRGESSFLSIFKLSEYCGVVFILGFLQIQRGWTRSWDYFLMNERNISGAVSRCSVSKPPKAVYALNGFTPLSLNPEICL